MDEPKIDITVIVFLVVGFQKIYAKRRFDVRFDQKAGLGRSLFMLKKKQIYLNL